MRSDAPQDHIFLDAFAGRFGVVHRVAGTGVKKAVVAARSARGDVRALDKQRPEAPHCAVPLRTGSGNSATYDNDVKFVRTHDCGLAKQIYKKTFIHAKRLDPSREESNLAGM